MHPIDQLARQMRLNDCPFGVITTGTRTFFVRASVGDDDVVTFSVSRRWDVGEQHYLRAWAWLVDEATRTPRLDCDALSGGKEHAGWLKLQTYDTADSLHPPNDDDDDDDDDEPWERPNTLGVLEIDGDDVELDWDRRLGYGRNGWVVEGCWVGRRVAVKQFDLDRGDGPHFQQELEAYSGLRHLQGTAVARLLFVSRSWCGTMRLMGLELGEQVPGDEPNLRSELRRVHAALREAGWSQDVEEKKIEDYVWQTDGKLVAIDLELLERRPSDLPAETSRPRGRRTGRETIGRD